MISITKSVLSALTAEAEKPFEKGTFTVVPLCTAPGLV
jgi:hypothetical protein